MLVKNRQLTNEKEQPPTLTRDMLASFLIIFTFYEKDMHSSNKQ